MFDMPIKKNGIQSLLFTVITCAYFNVATILFLNTLHTISLCLLILKTFITVSWINKCINKCVGNYQIHFKPQFSH